MIYFSGRSDRGIGRTSPDAERVEQVAVPGSDQEGRFSWPDVLPNGNGVIFTHETRGVAEILVWSLDNDHVTRLGEGQMARFARSGHLVYAAANGALVAAPFDMKRLEMGSSRSLRERVEVRGSTAIYFALSQTGTLVYLPRVPPPSAELVWVSRNGEATPVDVGWTFVPGAGVWGLDLAPDADRVAVSARDADDNTDIWIKALPDGPFDRLTSDVATEIYPAWTHDAQFVTYWRAGEGGGLWRSRADGTGSPQLLLEEPSVLVEGTWSHDGEWVVGRTENSSSQGRDIVGFRPGVHLAPVPLVDDPEAGERNAALSPDDGWLAYTSAGNVYVSPFPDVDGRIRRGSDPAGRRSVSTSGASSGRRDGSQRVLRSRFQAMRIRYFQDTDTLYIEFRERGVVDTKDLDENTTLDLDAEGNVLAITFEHASTRTDVRQLTLEGIAA
jgi:uncharacterized protein YuzE